MDGWEAGAMVTVEEDTAGIPRRFIEDCPDKTIYQWNHVTVKKGSIGIILGFRSFSAAFAKVLWVVNGESSILYVVPGHLKLVDLT